MMSKAHTFPPKYFTHTHTHTHTPFEEREQEKQDLETLLQMSTDELHMGGAPSHTKDSLVWLLGLCVLVTYAPRVFSHLH